MTQETIVRGAVAVTTMCLLLTSAGVAWAQKAESPRPAAPPAGGSPQGTASPSAPKGERPRPPPEPDVAAQKRAVAAFSFLDGVWVGPGWILQPSGEKVEFTQAERIGPMLDGLTRVIEGRGYGKGGQTTFNALGVISYDERSGRYEFRAYSHKGQVGTFEIKLTAPGAYQWEIPAGPAVIRYSTTVKDGVWHEVGDHVAPGRPPASSR